MERQTVTSSNIKSIGYDLRDQILEIEFNSGSIYQYFGVPQDIYLSLMNSGSYGQYFHANIKNIYPTQRVN